MSKVKFALGILMVCLSLASPAQAHFPWLVEESGKAMLFFGEQTADRTYKMPETIAQAKVELLQVGGKTTTLKMKPVETEKFVGLEGPANNVGQGMLFTKVTYGLYGGSRLNYYAVYQGGKLPKNLDTYKSIKLPLALQARLVDTDSGVDVYVTWNGKPLADAEVKLFCDDGHEEGNATTDKAGKVSFTDSEVEDGLNGIMVGHTVEETGEWKGEKYTKAANYLTLTFQDPK